jgi:stage V sporulation protein SpoVS
MGWQLRDHGYCITRAAGHQAVNTAIKAVAICNHRTQVVNVLLCVEAELERIEPDKPDMVAQLVIREVDFPKPVKMREYKISGQGDSDRLVRALLRPLQAGDGVSMNCIGPESVYRAVIAFVNVRSLLLPRIETVIIPSWQSILDKKQTPVNLIRLDVWGSPSNKV